MVVIECNTKVAMKTIGGAQNIQTQIVVERLKLNVKKPKTRINRRKRG